MALTISYTGAPPQVILFDKEPVSYAGDQAIHQFSIGRSRDSFGMVNRSIVTHIGTDKGNGTWICAKRETSCIHIRTAKRYMQYGVGDYSDGEESEEEDIDFFAPLEQDRGAFEEEDLESADSGKLLVLARYQVSTNCSC